MIPFPSLVEEMQVRLKGEERLVVMSKDLELMSFPSQVDFSRVCFSNSHLLHVCPSSVMSLSPSHLHVCERDMVTRGKMGNACEFERVNVTEIKVLHVDNFYHLFFPVRSTISLTCLNSPARYVDVRGGYLVQDQCGLQSPEVKLYPSNHRQFSYNVSVFTSPIYKKSYLSFKDDGLETVLSQLEEDDVPGPIEDDWQSILTHPSWSASSNVLSTTVFPIIVVIVVVVVVVLFRRHGARVTALMIDIVRSKKRSSPGGEDMDMATTGNVEQ